FTFPAHQRHIGAVAFSPDGRLLATCSWDKKVKVWDFERLRADHKKAPPLAEILNLPGRAITWRSGPAGKRWAASVDDGTVHVWDPATGQPVFDPLRGHRTTIRGLAYSPDGNYLASASVDNEDRTVRIWNARTGQEERTLAGHNVAFDEVESVS